MRWKLAYILTLWIIASPAVYSQKHFKHLKRCGNGYISEVLSGDQVSLDDGSTVILADVKAPEFWREEAPYKSWPYGFKSKTALSKVAKGQAATLYCGKPAKDTFGRTVAHIELPDGTWLQEHLLHEGHVLFFPNIAVGNISNTLISAENKARGRRKGLWVSPLYQPVNATGSDLKPGWFQTVKGTVYSAKKVGKTIYLNFDQDWRTDFTVQLTQKLERKYLKKELSPLTLAGQNIEVRGWVEWSGGPKIILTHTDQMQRLAVR